MLKIFTRTRLLTEKTYAQILQEVYEEINEYAEIKELSIKNFDIDNSITTGAMTVFITVNFEDKINLNDKLKELEAKNNRLFSENLLLKQELSFFKKDYQSQSKKIQHLNEMYAPESATESTRMIFQDWLEFYKFNHEALPKAFITDFASWLEDVVYETLPASEWSKYLEKFKEVEGN